MSTIGIRILQIGSDEFSPTCIFYLVGKVAPPGQPHLDDQLRAALPGTTIVCYTQADGEPLSTTKLRVERAIGKPPKGPVVLCGYSLGCSRGVRQRLRDGARPDAIICIDGTHASLPPADWQLDAWRPFIADARQGKRLVVMTCTGQTYVESDLPAAKRYQSTLNTLRQLSRWPLDRAGPLPFGEEHSDGDFHVHNYASERMDATAHSKQLTHVLPEMIRRYLTPWLAERRRPASDRPAAVEAETTPIPDAPPSSHPSLKRGSRGADVERWQQRLHELGFECGMIDGIFGPLTETATKTFQRVTGLLATGEVDEHTREVADNTEGVTVKMPSSAPRSNANPIGLSAALLAQARADLDAGVREEQANDGRRIRAYFEGTGVTPPAHWCAAAMRYWLRAAAREVRVEPPVSGSVGAKVWMHQLEKAGRWIHAVDLRREPHRLRPGMIVVWHRGAPNAPTGHIGVVATVTGAWKFTTIEGNSGDRSDCVAERSHNLSDGNLLGAGHID